jgi:hypothetical protein
MRTKIAKHRLAVAPRPAADAQWSKAGAPDSGPASEAHDGAGACEFETFRKMFDTFPATVAEAAALF